MIRRLPLFVIVFFLLAFLANAFGESKVRILYVNDFHGYAEPYTDSGSWAGVAALARRVDGLRNTAPSLLLSAGDMIQGNVWTNLFRGEPSIKVMNAMKFDAMTSGNHEFDFGKETLIKLISEASFPVLAANVGGLGGTLPYVVKDVGGVKTAIIGITTDETPHTTSAKNVEGLDFISPSLTVVKYLSELRGRADLFIVLSHLGIDRDRKLASEAPGIDVIVGGHSHSRLDRPEKIGKTLIVQAWKHARALGVLDVAVDGGSISSYDGRLELIESGMPEDAAIKALVDEYSTGADLVMGREIGSAQTDLDGEHVRERETNLGDFIADMIRDAAGADAAVINGGSIRRGIPKGTVRLRDVYNAFPFDNYIVTVRLSGEMLRKALEHGVSAVENNSGRFPQVSGLSFSFDPKMPPGGRISELFVSGMPVEERKEYLVAVDDFMAEGGDGYEVFKGVGGMKMFTDDSGRTIRDMLIGKIRSLGTISVGTDGRIRSLSYEPAGR